MKTKITYKDAGVDIEKGDLFVERIKKMVGKTYNQDVVSGVGGFASLYKRSDGSFLASGTDGVGTKLLVAQQLNDHSSIGIDLVAMCVNDILCTGADPLFFLDYLATGKLDLDIHEKVLAGIVEGCLQAGCALVGGETAEMPDLYQDGHYDLAGFAVGQVRPENLIDGQKLCASQRIVGLASSGVHSNGLSLVRKLLKQNSDPCEIELWKQALTPTKIYVKAIQALRQKYPEIVSGLAHITGGGVHNATRLHQHLDVVIEHWPSDDQIPSLFKVLKQRSGLDRDELFQTFNMGIGMMVMTDRPAQVQEFMREQGITAWDIGYLAKGEGKVRWA